ncbi:dihydrodipicolinate synthase family protein [Oceanobacillus kapialis]|uniref:dihydrodipicolinate synthase family protein n=1 Tax=Oceanobacillus kapialis TaxID=481353 RepID=UPI003850BFD1
MLKSTFHGIIPPVSTILQSNGELDKEGTKTVIDYLINAGVDGLFFLGSGGEFTQMSRELRMEVAAFTTEYVNRRVPVLIGTGSTSTSEAVLLSKHAEDVGADGVVVINPYYWNLSEENLLAHYGEIAEAINLPIMLYNFPELTGQDLNAETVLKLVDKYDNIIGIKETIDSIGHIVEMISTVKGKHPEFKVFAGFDNHLLNTLTMGGDGAICASVNFAPELAVGVYNAYKENNLQKALTLQEKLSIIPTMYKIDSPFVSVVKEAMKVRGLDISTYVLAPTQMLNDENKEKMKTILNKVNLLS